MRRRDGSRDVIRPDQIADLDVLSSDWPRADLNLACLELLIGLVFLADPPSDPDDWTTRQPDPDRLRAALAPLAPAFNLLGDGPRFLQDLEVLEGEEKPVEILFLDDPGNNSQLKNSDLMVKRDRYRELSPALAAISLYALQIYASGGGKGLRTSIRGGGPLVTLVRPAFLSLWELVWANVPEGDALPPDYIEELPWMGPSRSSAQGETWTQPEGVGLHPEVFFGMPRRIRLTAVDVLGSYKIAGVIQRPYGTNYVEWVHPLTPYRFTKGGKSSLKTEVGTFGYRNWKGVIFLESEHIRVPALQRYLTKRPGQRCDLIVAGWAMKKGQAKALDFLWSEAPVFPLDRAGEAQAAALVEAAEHAGYVLALNVKDGVGEGEITTGAGARVREQFFADTQAPFEEMLNRISEGQGSSVASDWLAICRRMALGLFDAEVMPGLADLSETRRQAAVGARRSLLAAFSGHAGMGKKIYDALNLERPKRGKKQEVAL
ncbi:type I-E CRISPR-associated protein Cse1/CasA [Shimia sp. R9_3]|nr:type I-E CRISPR-associated protein Cse1/CasA [Shimia sp. R9_3]